MNSLLPRWSRSILLVLTAVVSAVGACAPEGDRQLRLATFNAHNLEVSSSADQRSAVSEIIRRTRADIVLLQEIEGRAALDRLAADPAFAQEFPFRTALPGNDSRGFGLGLLARVRPALVRSHAGDAFGPAGTGSGAIRRFTRDCLEVHLSWSGLGLVLLGVHFRAKLADDPEQRLAEAEYTRSIADDRLSQDPHGLLAVLGDFNDVPGSEPLSMLAGGAASRLSSISSLLSPEERYSFSPSSSPDARVLFDDLLASPALWRALRTDSVTILHDDDLPEELADTSDHSPVAASFTLGGAE